MTNWSEGPIRMRLKPGNIALRVKIHSYNVHSFIAVHSGRDNGLTDAFINTRAKQLLTEWHWPASLTPEFTLAWCQGDGVMFTGQIDTGTLLELQPYF